MIATVPNFINKNRSMFFLFLFLFASTHAQATPTIVDSISASQFPGVELGNISSISVKSGTLLITDESQKAYRWKRGEKPTLFQEGNKKQRFSSLIRIDNDKYVLTDSRNSQFLVSNKDSWDIFSSAGDQEGEIKRPTAAAWSKHGILYIADQSNNRISAFTEEGLFLFTFGDDADRNNADQNLKNIITVATDRRGRVYVMDETGGGRVNIYSPLGELDTIIGKDEFKLLLHDTFRLTTMTVRPDGVLIVADKKSGRILELDWESMSVISSFGTNGKGRGQFQRVTSLTLDEDGKLYVADKGNKKIEVFQLDWRESPWLSPDADTMSVRPSSVLLSACEVSYIYAPEEILCINTSEDEVSIRSHDGVILHQLDAKFDRPIRAVFDDSEVLVLDDDDVKVFDKQGKFKFNFGSKGHRDGDFSDANALTMTKSSIYIVDSGNQRIQVFSRNGLFQSSIGHAKGAKVKLENPSAIAISDNGNIYVADNKLHQVLIYSSKGLLVKQLGFPEDHLHEFTYIYDILTEKDDMVYILTAMANNPLSVWVYKGAEYVYRFSPTHQKAVAGFDQQWAATPKKKKLTSVAALTNAAKNALNSTVSITLDLTLGPVMSLFTGSGGFFGSQSSWIFNRIPNRPSSVSIVDVSNHARHTFIVSLPPKQIRDIVVSGNEQNAHITWLPESDAFNGYYTLYGRKDISEPFKIIQKTITPELTLARATNAAIEYRISASTPLDKEGKLSSIYQDEFWLGYLAYQEKDYNTALNMLSEATLTNPQHASAWLYLGKTQMAMDSFEQASSSFINLAKIKGWEQKSIHLRAQALMKKEAWLDVKSLVDNAEARGNVDAYLYSLSAKALANMDDVPSAIYYLNQAVKIEPSSAIWHLQLADANFQLGAEKTAKKEILTATQLAGKDTLSWLEIARTYAKYNLLDDAVVAYDRVLAIETNHVEALPELANLQMLKKNYVEARSLATRMASIPELKGTSYYILGQIALAEDNAPQALAMLAKAGQTDPNNASIWLSMANAYAALHKPARETEYLLKANAVDTNNFDVHMRLAAACLQNEDDVCTNKHYKQAVVINNKSLEAQLGLANSYIRLGRMTDAEKHAALALRIKAKSIPAHLTLAEVQSKRGMIPASIATLKKASSIDSSNMDVHLALSKAYIDNHMYDEAVATTEQAMLLDVRNPEPLMLNGSIYLARQSFDKAIGSFEKAVELAPDNTKYRLQLNTAYLQKKRSVDAGGSMVGLKLNTPQFSRVFSAAYKQYTDIPVGSLKISNESAVDYTNIKVSLFVKEYMDFPTTTVVERVPANGEVVVPLLAAFNNRILSIDEDTGVQTEVRAEYYLAGKPHEDTQHESLTIYGKNAIVWDKLNMVGSFATPKDDALAVFIRQLTNAYAPKGGAVNPRVAKAMTVYNGLSAYGIKYLLDPNTPYDKLDSAQLDTVQFPRETLRQRSGDCDDLSILLSASLSNLGIETAILDVPQHLLMMFNTGVSEDRKDVISLNNNALAILNGQVWIPLEATLIASSFTEAWAEGARKYHLYGKQSKMKIMPLATAWKDFPPVTLPPADFKLNIPDQAAIGDKISKEWDILSVKALERQVRPYRIMLALDDQNVQAQMQIAVVYARNGLYDQATIELENIHEKDANNIAALNNLGNIYYLKHDYPKALDMYKKATGIQPNNADIKVNMAMVNYKMGDALQAKVYFDEASAIDDQVPKRYEQLAFLLHQ